MGLQKSFQTPPKFLLHILAVRMLSLTPKNSAM